MYGDQHNMLIVRVRGSRNRKLREIGPRSHIETSMMDGTILPTILKTENLILGPLGKEPNDVGLQLATSLRTLLSGLQKDAEGFESRPLPHSVRYQELSRNSLKSEKRSRKVRDLRLRRFRATRHTVRGRLSKLTVAPGFTSQLRLARTITRR